MGVIQHVRVEHEDGRDSLGYLYHHDIGREGWAKIFGNVGAPLVEGIEGQIPLLSIDAYKLAVAIIITL